MFALFFRWVDVVEIPTSTPSFHPKSFPAATSGFRLLGAVPCTDSLTWSAIADRMIFVWPSDRFRLRLRLLLSFCLVASQSPQRGTKSRGREEDAHQ